MLLALCLIMLLTGAIAGSTAYELHKVNNRLDNFGDAVSQYFEAAEGEYSAFTQTINSVADVIAQKQGVTTVAAIRGAMGGQQKAINEGLEEMALEENPQLGFMGMLPKSLKKNPLALMALQKLINNQTGLGQAGGQVRKNGSQSAPAKFNL